MENMKGEGIDLNENNIKLRIAGKRKLILPIFTHQIIWRLNVSKMKGRLSSLFWSLQK